MLTVETKEIIISEELKRKVDFICKFANSKPTYFNGSIRSIKGTNIAYVEPHQVLNAEIHMDEKYKRYENSSLFNINYRFKQHLERAEERRK